MEKTPGCSLHFVFIPLMVPCHIPPMVDMTKLIARRNVKVTIVTTPRGETQFRAIIDRDIQSKSPIQTQLVTLHNRRFEERVKDRGILNRDYWVPQVSIFSHKEVGAFFTHGGWMSTLDAICAAVPLVALPVSVVEMLYNEKLLAHVAEIGVAMRAEIAIHCGEDEYGECVDEYGQCFKEVIEKVMREGEDQDKRRQS
ncbi:UDP-glycosyltransferase 73C7 [Glycine soja]|nr:UDP-glycosyltransferase 73C7 [Glycine soja]